MAFTHINTTTTASSNASVTINVPSGVQNGDIIFLLVGHNETFGGTTFPSGFNILADVTGIWGSDNVYATLLYKIASSEGATYSMSVNGGNASDSYTVCSAFRGDFDTADPIDVVSNSNYVTNDTVCRAASMVVSAVNSPLLFFGAGRRTAGSLTYTKPSVPTNDWVEVSDSGESNSDFYFEVCHMKWTGSGATGDMDATMSTNIATKRGFAVALNPSAPNTSKFFQLF